MIICGRSFCRIISFLKGKETVRSKDLSRMNGQYRLRAMRVNG
jgi:hypothetical protein